LAQDLVRKSKTTWLWRKHCALRTPPRHPIQRAV
jgi:hypothetical protein